MLPSIARKVFLRSSNNNNRRGPNVGTRSISRCPECGQYIRYKYTFREVAHKLDPNTYVFLSRTFCLGSFIYFLTTIYYETRKSEEEHRKVREELDAQHEKSQAEHQAKLRAFEYQQEKRQAVHQAKLRAMEYQHSQYLAKLKKHEKEKQ
jgi:hypothetical protein